MSSNTPRRTPSHGKRKDVKLEAVRPDSRASVGDANASRMDTPGYSSDSRMDTPFEEPSSSSSRTPLQVAGRGSPQDDRGTPSGFGKTHGMRAVNTTVAPLHVDRRYWPKDMRGLLEIYEQGYTLQQGMKDHCKETTDALGNLAGHCDNTVKMLVEGMHNVLREVQMQVEKPANVDWTPVMEALEKIDRLQPAAIGADVTQRLQTHEANMCELEKRMEEKLSERIQRVETSALEIQEVQRTELDMLRADVKYAQKLSTNITDGVKQIEDQLMETLGNQHRALKADFSQTLQDVLRVQEKNRRADMANVEPLLEGQLKRILSEHQEVLEARVASNTEKVLKSQQDQGKYLTQVEQGVMSGMIQQFERAKMGDKEPTSKIKDIHRIVSDDISQMFNEIAKIQKHMNLDYVCKQRPVPASFGSSRFREFMTQTEETERRNAPTQTDDHYFKQQRRKVENQRKMLARASRRQVAEVKEVKPERRKSGFGDHERKVQKMRENLIKPSYNVAQFYKDSGCARAIAVHPVFEYLTTVVILLNAVWIAVDTDNNDAMFLVDAELVFQIAENLFCSYFTGELLIRMAAFKNKINCLYDFSFVFDLFLCTGMVAETWMITSVLLIVGRGNGGSYASGLGSFSILRMARLAKMLRMARMARLLRMVPELVVIIKSIGVAFRSVGFFLLLMVIILYVFAVFFRQATKETALGQQYFDTVPKAMNSLLLDGVLPLYAPLINDVSSANYLYWPVIIVFVLLASVTVMNMLIGVLVEVVRTVAAREHDAMMVIHVTNELRAVMGDFQELQNPPENESPQERPRIRHSLMSTGTITNVSGDGLTRLGSCISSALTMSRTKTVTPDIPPMSKDDFASFLSYAPVCSLLRDCGVDAVGLLQSVDMIFEEKVRDNQVGLSFMDFVGVVLNMRGSNAATVKDVRQQMSLFKESLVDNSRTSAKKMMSQIATFRSDMMTQLQELRKSIDSDAGSDDDGSMKERYGSELAYDSFQFDDDHDGAHDHHHDQDHDHDLD